MVIAVTLITTVVIVVGVLFYQISKARFKSARTCACYFKGGNRHLHYKFVMRVLLTVGCHDGNLGEVSCPISHKERSMSFFF